MERSQTDARALSSKQAHQKPGVNNSSEKGLSLSGLIKLHDTDEMGCAVSGGLAMSMLHEENR